MARRIRNYRAMLDENLRAAYRELQFGGEAYDRCVAYGSGDPARDLRVVYEEMQARGLLTTEIVEVTADEFLQVVRAEMQTERRTMTNEEVFMEIFERDADKAVVSFSGGNDEGGADAIGLYKGDKLIAELATWFEHSDDPNYAFVNALTEPVYNRYGSFAGEFYVSGGVVWDAHKLTCTMDDEYRPTEDAYYDE